MTEPAQTAGNDTPPPEPSWGGCLVPAVVLTVFFCAGIWALTTGYRQSKELAKFVDDKPLEFAPIQPSQDQLAHVKAATEQIRRAATDGTAAEVPLTVEDLNTLIATAPVLDAYRATARVRSITSRGMAAEMSQELRGKRFLNGTYSFTPARSQTNTWQLILDDIVVPGREVPRPFIEAYRNLHMFRFDAALPELQAALKRIEEIRLEEGRLIIVVPAAAKPDPS